MKKYEIIKGKFGSTLVLNSEWKDKLIKIVHKKKITGLELNHAKGWKGSDLSFLKELRSLREFSIIDFKINNIEDVHFLTELKCLDINTYCKSEIDFTKFNSLEDVSIEWRPKAKSLFACQTLKGVFINNWIGKNLTEFDSLTDIESISLNNSKIVAIGQTKLHKIKELRINRALKLASLSGIEKFTDLIKLEINDCKKINNLNEIELLSNLTSLSICNNGEVETLKPLANLKNLEELLFYESTNIKDGKLSVLNSLPKLKKIAFQERKHYDQKRDDFI